MANIATLALQITANAGGFNASLTAAQARIKQFGDTITDSLVGQAVGALAALTQKSFDAIAAVAKLAQRFGATFETMDAFAFAGERVGLSVDEVGQGMAAFARRAGEMQLAMSAGQSNEMEVALRRLGLEAGAVAALPIPEQLGVIGDALRGIESPAQRAALSYAILGRQAAALQPILARGSAFLRESGRLNDQLGLAATGDQAKNVLDAKKEAKEASLYISSVLESIGMAIAVAVAPAIKDVAAFIKEMVLAAQPALDVLRTVLAAVATAAGAVAQAFVKLMGPLLPYIATLGQLVAIVAVAVLLWKAKILVMAIYQAVMTALPIVIRAVALAFSTLRSAIMSTGIGVLIVALGVLIERLTATRQAAADAARAQRDAAADMAATAALRAAAPQEEMRGNIQRLVGRGEMSADRGARELVGANMAANAASGLPAEAAFQLATDLSQANSELLTQAQRVQMTAEQWQAFQFQMRGATEAELARLRVNQQIVAAANARAAAERARQQGAETVEQMREQYTTMGMTARQIQIYRLARSGAAAADIEEARTLDALMSRFEAHQEQQRRTAAVLEEITTPLERFESRMGELGDMLLDGELSWEQYARAATLAGEALDRTGHASVQMPGALTQGSGAALSAINRFQVQGAQGREDPAERLRRVAEEQRNLQQRQLREAELLRAAFEDHLLGTLDI